MKKINTTKKHLLVKRCKIIKFLKSEGYTGADIAIMLNMEESSISRLLSADEKYKKSVKNLLKK